MVWMEQNVFLAFLAQALIIATIFSLAICWFSFIKRFCNISLFSSAESIDDPDHASESNKKPNYPQDMPPSYNEADQFSQLEVQPSDILFPPPLYKDLHFDTINQSSKHNVDEIIVATPPLVAFATPYSSNRRYSAPAAASLTYSRDPFEFQPESRHRNSIDDSRITDNEPETTTSIFFPILWPLRGFSKDRGKRTKNRKRQIDHAYFESDMATSQVTCCYVNEAMQGDETNGDITVITTTSSEVNAISDKDEEESDEASCQDNPGPGPGPGPGPDPRCRSDSVVAIATIHSLPSEEQNVNTIQ